MQLLVWVIICHSIFWLKRLSGPLAVQPDFMLDKENTTKFYGMRPWHPKIFWNWPQMISPYNDKGLSHSDTVLKSSESKFPQKSIFQKFWLEIVSAIFIRDEFSPKSFLILRANHKNDPAVLWVPSPAHFSSMIYGSYPKQRLNCIVQKSATLGLIYQKTS